MVHKLGCRHRARYLHVQFLRKTVFVDANAAAMRPNRDFFVLMTHRPQRLELNPFQVLFDKSFRQLHLLASWLVLAHLYSFTLKQPICQALGGCGTLIGRWVKKLPGCTSSFSRSITS